MKTLGAKVDSHMVLNQPVREGKVHYTRKDCILYALGLGCRGQKEHRYIYELHPSFGPLPTMPVVWNNNPSDVKIFGGGNNKKNKEKKTVKHQEWGMFGPGIPKFNTNMLLHGEEYIELAKPGGLPTHGAFLTESKPIGVHDKGKGLLLENQTTYKDGQTGKVVCKTVAAMYVRGITGFKSAGKTYSKVFKRPSRIPDNVVEMEIDPYAAELYRVNGDYNPLHIDWPIAKSVGFKGPILHGLCTFGMAARSVMQAYTGGDPKTFKAIKVRFASPVFPGETLVTEMWDDDNNESHPSFKRVHFETKMKGSNKTVLSSAYVDFFSTTSKL